MYKKVIAGTNLLVYIGTLFYILTSLRPAHLTLLFFFTQCTFKNINQSLNKDRNYKSIFAKRFFKWV